MRLKMDKTYQPAKFENEIYKFWEEKGLLKRLKGKPYTILMPPPNANASLHAGHGMYAVDDILIRYKRLLGYTSLWIPGLDHAGFETQYVYEQHLKKQGKSRFDFDRETLYKDMYIFVQENSGLIYKQFRRLGFLADWTRSAYTLDKHVIERVYKTFKQMWDEGLVYRDDYIVNYCIHCGTSLSELETEYIERKDPLYYLKYGPFVLATVRPETKFGDTAVAVHPDDKRYKKWIGKEIEVEGLIEKFRLKVIADEAVDPEFGTGVVKVTPANDPNDFEIGKRHNLELKKIINLDGRLNEAAGPYKGLTIKKARKRVVEDLQKKGLVEKINKDYEHSVSICYRCRNDLEPTVIPNWFIKVEELKKPVIEIVKKDRVRFFPKKYKKQMLDWLREMHDWPISRQIVWGIRIPAWQCTDCKELIVTAGITPTRCNKCGGSDLVQDEDTFDTWFSSGQWPLVTLKEDEYKTRFPTDFMGTLSDILRPWISRMIMFSLYVRNEVPFKDVYLWSMVADEKGVKMSKSKGNVIDPIDLVDKYGADAFRTTLFFGLSQGGKVNLSEDKVRGMRNFTNKVWNVGRFLFLYLNSKFEIRNPKQIQNSKSKNRERTSDVQTMKQLSNEFEAVKKQYFNYMDRYQFSRAFDLVYEFLWHRFADFYIEELKESLRNGSIEAYRVLEKVYLESLKMLHPFMPFITETVYKIFRGQKASILQVSFST